MSYALGILNRRRGGFPRTVFQEVALERLAAGDETVVAVWWRERRQKGECLAAKIAKAAPDQNPIMVFVMSLFAAAAMADDRILHTNRASPQENPGAGNRPIGFQVVLPRGKWDKKNRSNGGSARLDPTKIGAEAEPSPPIQTSQLEKNNASQLLLWGVQL